MCNIYGLGSNRNEAGLMDMKEKEKIEKLADEHWEWINNLLNTERLMTERLFKDGFLHGWKHAKVDK